MEQKKYVIDGSSQKRGVVGHLVKRILPESRYETYCGALPWKEEFYDELPGYARPCLKCKRSLDAIAWKEAQAAQRPRRRKPGEFLKGDIVRFKLVIPSESTICGVPVTVGTIIKAELSQVSMPVIK